MPTLNVFPTLQGMDSAELASVNRHDARKAFARFQPVYPLTVIQAGKVGRIIHVRDRLKAENVSICRAKDDEIRERSARRQTNAQARVGVFDACRSTPAREAVVEIDCAEIPAFKKIGERVQRAPVLRDARV